MHLIPTCDSILLSLSQGKRRLTGGSGGNCACLATGWFGLDVLKSPCSGRSGLPPPRLSPTAASLTPLDAAGRWFVGADQGVPLHRWSAQKSQLPPLLAMFKPTWL